MENDILYLMEKSRDINFKDLVTAFKSLFKKSGNKIQDSRSAYLWLFVSLFPIGMILAIIVVNFFYQRPSLGPNYVFGDILLACFIGIISFSLLLILPVRISVSDSKNKTFILKSLIPTILVLIVGYALYDYNTCTGKFCEVAGFVITILALGSFSAFYLSYYFSVLSRRLKESFIKSFLYLEVVLIVTLAIASVYFGVILASSNSIMNNLKNNQNVDADVIATICNTSDIANCLDGVMRTGRGFEICPNITDGNLRAKCMNSLYNYNSNKISEDIYGCTERIGTQVFGENSWRDPLSSSSEVISRSELTYSIAVEKIKMCWNDALQKYPKEYFPSLEDFNREYKDNICVYYLNSECKDYMKNYIQSL